MDEIFTYPNNLVLQKGVATSAGIWVTIKIKVFNRNID